MSVEAAKLVGRLLAAYNIIDGHMRSTLRQPKTVSFTELLREYVGLSHEDRYLLSLTGQIRNPLVHGPTRRGDYPLVPSVRFVRELEALRRRLTRPDRAIPTFERPVETVTPSESLAAVLKTIRKRSYSQFPVYQDGGLRFHGLLTENGITRWLANHVETQLSLVDLDEVRVSVVLREEEQGQNNFVFVTRDEGVGRIRQLFADIETLEAVLISPSGKRNERLLGIATRWDLLNRRQR